MVPGEYVERWCKALRQLCTESVPRRLTAALIPRMNEELEVLPQVGAHELISSCVFGSTGSPAACQAVQPPASARALGQPACRSSRATRALVASLGQAQ